MKSIQPLLRQMLFFTCMKILFEKRLQLRFFTKTGRVFCERFMTEID